MFTVSVILIMVSASGEMLFFRIMLCFVKYSHRIQRQYILFIEPRDIAISRRTHSSISLPLLLLYLSRQVVVLGHRI